MRAQQISALGVGVIFGILAFAVIWVGDIRGGQIPGRTGLVFDLGSITLDLADAQTRINVMVNPTAALMVDNYDSFDSPLGTDFIVAAGMEFHITAADLPHDNPRALFSIGYGDTHVEDSAAAPTNAVILYRTTIDDQSEHFFPLHMVIPAGKHPFLLFESGTSTLDGAGTFWGVSLDVPE